MLIDGQSANLRDIEIMRYKSAKLLESLIRGRLVACDKMAKKIGELHFINTPNISYGKEIIYSLEWSDTCQ